MTIRAVCVEALSCWKIQFKLMSNLGRILISIKNNRGINASCSQIWVSVKDEGAREMRPKTFGLLGILGAVLVELNLELLVLLDG
jgi:hypothetical protein